MKSALEEQQSFTDKMRDKYISIISANILSLQKIHKHLVVTQGVYKQRHRDYLLKKIPNMEMIWVKATDSIILQRLSNRNQGITMESAAALKLDFEPPANDIKVIINDGDRFQIVDQLNQFYAMSSNISLDGKRSTRGFS